jgi:hypothetical protein
MRETRLSGSMSGRWNRGTAGRVRHRQTKGPDNGWATPKLPRHLSTLPDIKLFLSQHRVSDQRLSKRPEGIGCKDINAPSSR